MSVDDSITLQAALSRNIAALLKNCGNPGTCRGCNAPIVWMVHNNGKKVPYTLAGLNHFADCPAAQRFKKETPAHVDRPCKPAAAAPRRQEAKLDLFPGGAAEHGPDAVHERSP